MTDFFLKITLIICAFYLPACSTTISSATFSPVTAEEDQAVVYIYRPSVMSNAMYTPDLYVNDKFKFTVKNGNNVGFSLNPGEYKFEVAPDKNYSGRTTLSVNLIAGVSYFIRVDTSLKIVSSTNYEPYNRSFSLIKVEQEMAVKEIAQCCTTTNNKAAVKLEEELIKKESNEGFSVDKTQNPFSH